MSIELLLVEDDLLAMATMSQGLRRFGYRVATAESAEAALQIVGSTKPGLAIIDINLPGMSGVELARLLTAEFGVFSLFLTAYADHETVAEAIRDGAVGYIVKPVSAEQLMPAVETAAARIRDLKALMQAKDQLERALSADRHASVAIGLLMERERLSEQASFEKLRNDARRRRLKLADYCAGIVAAQEELVRK